MSQAKAMEEEPLPAGQALSGALDQLSGLMRGKSSLAEGLGVDRAGLEGFYGVSRNLYASGRYPEAVRGFEMLCLYDHTNADYWLALGRCRQMMADDFGAGMALALAAELGAPPALRLDVLECMIAAGEPELAEAAMRRIESEGGHASSGRLKLLMTALNHLRAKQGS